MAQPASDALSAIFLDHRDEVLEDWIASQQSAVTLRPDLISSVELVDSFIGRMLGNIAAMARVLDVDAGVAMLDRLLIAEGNGR